MTDFSTEQVRILIAFDVVNLEFGRPVFLGSETYFARTVTVGELHAVFARKLN